MTRKDALEQVVHNLRHKMPPLRNGAHLLCAATEDENYKIVALWDRPKGVEYIVWTMLPDGECVWGHYFNDLEAALDYFLEITEKEVVSG